MKIIQFIFFTLFLITQNNFSQDYTQYVDPFIGTDYHGHTYPGATVPFGIVQLSPDNGRSGWDWSSGYHYSDSLIVGFSHTHLSGTGIGDLCDIQFMPASFPNNISDEEIVKQKFISKFDHNNEKASVGYYSVLLKDYNISSELTAALRSGLQKHTFKKDGKEFIQLDLAYSKNWDMPIDTFIKIVDDHTICGYRYSTGWAKDQRVYFHTQFSKPIAKSFLIQDSVYLKDRKEIKGKYSRAIFQFDLKTNSELLIKTGISSVSFENAKLNLENDIKDWNFDKVKNSAVEQWNKELSKIEIKSSNKSYLKTFYTSLYRSMLAPIVFSDVNGEYKGADGKIHQAKNYTKYSIFSLWDTFRAEHPLFTITQPDKVNDMINSMLSHYDEYGLLPVWELLGNETGTMIGYHAVPVIADAILKGFNGFDVNHAYDAMKKSAMQDHLGLNSYKKLGYIADDKEVESVSKTLEYAYDDWCIAQVAIFLDKEEDYKYFSNRAEYYRNLFDPTTNFMRAKLSDGKWKTTFNPRSSEHRNNEYTEGNAWQYSWFVPQDVEGLISLIGRKEKFTQKLDLLFSIDSKLDGENPSSDISGMVGQYAHGNEPSQHISYLYNFVGQPWKTQQKVHQILTTLYNDSPSGLCGNEDCGQMSAWYIFSALGFYPFNPADQNYIIGSPLFDEAIINLSDGKKFVIKANNLSDKNIYINSAKLNGTNLTKSFITHNDIMNGGLLEFEMSDNPNHNLWTNHESFPLSMTTITNVDEIDNKEYSEKIKEAFKHAWNAYKKYAWGQDQPKPLSKTFRNWYGESLLMTPVDAFDTMVLMGLKEESEEAKKLIFEKLNFNKNISVQNFEVTIRLLGGLISAYQLDGDKRFLDLAEDLGNRLLPVFNSKTGMPYRYVNLQNGELRDSINNPAEIGTLMLEFGMLSKLTGNNEFYDKAKDAITEVYNRRSKIGLVGTQINVETGEWTNTDSHISGMIDSYYEYLIKAYLLFGDEDFKTMYDESIKSVNKYLLDSVETGLWYAHADMNTGVKTQTVFGALDAFMPAMLVLGDDLATAEKIQESCYKMWNHFGIEPEEINYKTFEVTAPYYILRPENIESAFYLYRKTKNPKYLEMGKTFFDSIEEYCKVDEGYASLKSVMSKEKMDSMESFFLAETLKYLYLIFAPEETLDLNKFVFNTEAHPLRKLNK
ncbi:MAG: GH92 family glycosyl hydrolase [Ignavibacteriales bacterium]|nr:GH92 family glycosyl hydrolase [Ignavibacteriales bacterium]